MHTIFRTTQFKKDYKKLSTSHKKVLKIVILQLAQRQKLDAKYKDHQLTGNFLGCRECHIKPDLLLIYRTDKQILELTLVRVGSHSKLLGK